MNNPARSYSFADQLQFSLARQRSDMDAIEAALGCVRVVKSSTSDDRNGVDYWAELRSGRSVGVEAKTREAGCSRYWRNGPELALEVWSNEERQIAGWTLDSRKQSEYVLFTFAPSDTRDTFLIPFQLLRLAFVRHGRQWARQYRWARQLTPGSRQYHSACVFVPAYVVIEAVTQEMYVAPAMTERAAA